MNFLKHAYQQPLIFATGLAALVHSTWSLGTMFSGQQPAIESITTKIGYVHFAGWLLPALLIAFALDIGQIITSHEIRTRGMTKARAITFVVFALATYYLQWLYMAHHMPLVELAEGISSIHRDAALWLRNMGLWLIPSLLPLSTLLYTFSTENDDMQPHVAVKNAPQINIVEPEIPILESMDLSLLEAENPVFSAECDCGWQRDYDNQDSATRGLNAHQQKCSIYQDFAHSENGKVHHANN